MAKKIAIAALVLFLILFAVIQGRYINSTYDELSGAADNIGLNIEKKDLQQTNNSIDEFGSIWEENSDIWMTLMLHEHVDSVYKNYLLMKEFAREGDLKNAAVYLQQLQYSLRDVNDLDQLNVKNIF
jgi:hypothetical protein